MIRRQLLVGGDHLTNSNSPCWTSSIADTTVRNCLWSGSNSIKSGRGNPLNVADLSTHGSGPKLRRREREKEEGVEEDKERENWR